MSSSDIDVQPPQTPEETKLHDLLRLKIKAFSDALKELDEDLPKVQLQQYVHSLRFTHSLFPSFLLNLIELPMFNKQ
jgi:hypothetical protein